jgi:hypothetical protein
VVLVGSLAQLAGRIGELDLPVTTVKQLFEQLTDRYPAIERHVADGVAVVILSSSRSNVVPR